MSSTPSRMWRRIPEFRCFTPFPWVPRPGLSATDRHGPAGVTDGHAARRPQARGGRRWWPVLTEQVLAGAASSGNVVIPARSQMGASFGFHIVFSCFGVAFPAIVLIAHWRGIRRGDADALRLARRWSKVMA